MLLDYLKENDVFMIVNQYNMGEFTYLGDFVGEHKKTKERAKFNRHVQVEVILDGEEVLPLLEDKL